jgi:hypothetical protein
MSVRHTRGTASRRPRSVQPPDEAIATFLRQASKPLSACDSIAQPRDQGAIAPNRMIAAGMAHREVFGTSACTDRSRAGS